MIVLMPIQRAYAMATMDGSGMTRRRLRPDEVELWRQIAATTDRLHPEAISCAEELIRQGPSQNPARHRKPRLPEFSVGQATRQATVTSDLKPALVDQLRGAPVSMDSKAFARMKRGKLVP
jgi:DNA-nicking Smr family endonuclease